MIRQDDKGIRYKMIDIVKDDGDYRVQIQREDCENCDPIIMMMVEYLRDYRSVRDE